MYHHPQIDRFFVSQLFSVATWTLQAGIETRQTLR